MTELHIPSYPSIWALGHRNSLALKEKNVIIEEKVDGSQASISVHYVEGEGMVLAARSKGQDLIIDAPEKMFLQLIVTLRVLAHQLIPGMFYRGEFLAKPKHNTLAYDRAPALHFILFDIERKDGSFLSREAKEAEAQRLGLEVVPLLHRGPLPDAETLLGFMNTISCLGGQKIEGIVVKPEDYDIYGPDKKLVMAKFVSEGFKETNNKDWKERHPSGGDIIETLAIQYRTPARWEKAVQHLRDAGKLDGSPKDIGALMVETKADVRKEEEDAIKQALFDYAWPKIQRTIVYGLPEWYKEKLVKDSL